MTALQCLLAYVLLSWAFAAAQVAVNFDWYAADVAEFMEDDPSSSMIPVRLAFLGTVAIFVAISPVFLPSEIVRGIRRLVRGDEGGDS